MAAIPNDEGRMTNTEADWVLSCGLVSKPFHYSGFELLSSFGFGIFPLSVSDFDVKFQL